MLVTKLKSTTMIPTTKLGVKNSTKLARKLKSTTMIPGTTKLGLKNATMLVMKLKSTTMIPAMLGAAKAVVKVETKVAKRGVHFSVARSA